MTDPTTQAHRSGALPRGLYSPHTVILANLDEVRFGDILLDTPAGPLRVDELVHRRGIPVAEFAEHRPALAMHPASELRRIIRNDHHLLRVARDIEKFAPLPGHSTRVRSHNPVRRGMYVLNDGWLAACSCGWPDGQRVCGGKQSARREWLEHKAEVISSGSAESHPGLALVAAAERLAELPPIPWSFARNGAAVARLNELGFERGFQAARAWADALGVGIDREDDTTFYVAVTTPGTRRAVVAIDGFYEPEGGAAQ